MEDTRIYNITLTFDEVVALMCSLSKTIYEDKRCLDYYTEEECIRSATQRITENKALYKKLLNAPPAFLDTMEKDYHDRYDTANQSQ